MLWGQVAVDEPAPPALGRGVGRLRVKAPPAGPFAVGKPGGAGGCPGITGPPGGGTGFPVGLPVGPGNNEGMGSGGSVGTGGGGVGNGGGGGRGIGVGIGVQSGSGIGVGTNGNEDGVGPSRHVIGVGVGVGRIPGAAAAAPVSETREPGATNEPRRIKAGTAITAPAITRRRALNFIWRRERGVRWMQPPI